MKNLVVAITILVISYLSYNYYIAQVTRIPTSSTNKPKSSNITKNESTIKSAIQKIKGVSSKTLLDNETDALISSDASSSIKLSAQLIKPTSWDKANEGRLTQVIKGVAPDDITLNIEDLNKRQFAEGEYPTACSKIMTDGYADDCKEYQLYQDMDKDIEWRYAMEEKLIHLINLSRQPKGFKIVDVVCKQLVCELLLIRPFQEPYDETNRAKYDLSIAYYLYHRTELPFMRRDTKSHWRLVTILPQGNVEYFVLSFYEDTTN